MPEPDASLRRKRGPGSLRPSAEPAEAGFAASSQVPEFLPGSPVPGQEAVNQAFHEFICGVTGLLPHLARPRWQPGGGPAIPESEVNWAAFGVIAAATQGFAGVIHLGDGAEGQGSSRLVAHRDLTLMISFYGPQAQDLAEILLDGLHIDRNRALLRKNQLTLAGFEGLVNVPELGGNGWQNRTDITLHFTRRVEREYGVRNLASAGLDIQTDSPDVSATLEISNAGGMGLPCKP